MFVVSTPCVCRGRPGNIGMRGGGLRRFGIGVWRYLRLDGAAECPRAFFFTISKLATAADTGEAGGSQTRYENI